VRVCATFIPRVRKARERRVVLARDGKESRTRKKEQERERERERERDINRRDGMKQKIMPSTRACVRVRAQISSIRRDRPEVAPFSFGNFWGRDIVYRSPSPHSRHRCHPVKTGGKRVRLPRKGSE